jgi:hypothetical protein
MSAKENESPAPEKISIEDFEFLLDNYESVIVRRSQPGSSTMNHARHEARRALINAAKIGLGGNKSLIEEFAGVLRRAMVKELAHAQLHFKRGEQFIVLEPKKFIAEEARKVFANYAVTNKDIERIRSKALEGMRGYEDYLTEEGNYRFNLSVSHQHQAYQLLHSALLNATIIEVTR